MQYLKDFTNKVHIKIIKSLYFFIPFMFFGIIVIIYFVNGLEYLSFSHFDLYKDELYLLIYILFAMLALQYLACRTYIGNSNNLIIIRGFGFFKYKKNINIKKIKLIKRIKKASEQSKIEMAYSKNSWISPKNTSFQPKVFYKNIDGSHEIYDLNNKKIIKFEKIHIYDFRKFLKTLKGINPAINLLDEENREIDLRPAPEIKIKEFDKYIVTNNLGYKNIDKRLKKYENIYPGKTAVEIKIYKTIKDPLIELGKNLSLYHSHNIISWLNIRAVPEKVIAVFINKEKIENSYYTMLLKGCFGETLIAHMKNTRNFTVFIPSGKIDVSNIKPDKQFYENIFGKIKLEKKLIKTVVLNLNNEY